MPPGRTGLQDAETAQLLDTIDKLRSLGSLSQDISLPQIIVVGQQSSGKSSVLGAISGIPFPVNDGLCTQFATEVILRRSKHTKRSASINTIDPFDVRAKLRNVFADRWKSFEASDVEQIINEAKECMSLEKQGITHDKLRLEISGPDQDHLTLVDLPGLIVNARLSQSDSSVESIRKLVISYTRQPLSTILAVVSGQTELENQAILGLLTKLDDGSKIKRILGVLTQPDTVHAGTVKEKIFLALAENQEFPLAHGWHVLRNLSSTERQEDKDRWSVEKEFFEREAPWCNLTAERVGVTKLKNRLSKVLLSEIASQLGNILDRIEMVISATTLALDKLGDERSTSEQQRLFLMKIGDQYKHLMSCALEGEYRDTFFDHYAHRLRARIADENIKFASSMLNHGHRWNVKASTTSLIIAKDANVRAQLIEHVQKMQKSYRGNELHGMFPASLVDRLFKEQACSWHSIAVLHINTVLGFVKNFLRSLLHHVGGDQTALTLLEHLIGPEMDRKEILIREKLDELLYPYLVAHPLTLNARYVMLLSAARKVWQSSSSMFGQVSPNTDVLACEQIVDIMVAYYDIALSVFVDNVATLAIEKCLLSDLPQLISPVKIAQESNKRLAVLGSESVEMVSERHRLRRKLQDYKEGQKTIRQHIQRHVHYTGHPNEILESSETAFDEPVKCHIQKVEHASSLNNASQESSGKMTGPSIPIIPAANSGTFGSGRDACAPVVSNSSSGLSAKPNDLASATTSVFAQPRDKMNGSSSDGSSFGASHSGSGEKLPRDTDASSTTTIADSVKLAIGTTSTTRSEGSDSTGRKPVFSPQPVSLSSTNLSSDKSSTQR